MSSNVEIISYCFKKPARAIARIIPLFFLAAGIMSCEKEHMFDFLKSTGNDITAYRNVNGNFTEIVLENDINLVLTQGPAYEIKLVGGENMLPGIDTDIADSTLTLRNNNKFNWVRSYDRKITAYVTLPHLLRLGYKATGNVTNTDTIREDSLFVVTSGGSGYIQLLIKTKSSHLSINAGSADIEVSGISGVNYIYSNGYGPFHCLNLQTDITYITSNSTNDCYVNVRNLISYNLLSLGNIFYIGNPQKEPGKVTGSGKLLPYQ
jgi:hypothetical protein